MTIRTQTQRETRPQEPYSPTMDPKKEEVYSEAPPPLRLYHTDSSSNSEQFQADYASHFEDQYPCPPITHVYSGSSYSVPNFPSHYYCEQSYSPRVFHMKHPHPARISSESCDYNGEGATMLCHPISSFGSSTNVLEAAPVMPYYPTASGIAANAPHHGRVVYHPSSHDQTTDGSSGRRICAVPQGVETTASVPASWMYCPPPPPVVSNGPPPPPYAYHHGLTVPPMIPSPSGYPLLCPPPVFYRVVPPPPPVSPRDSIDDMSKGPIHRKSFSSSYPSATSTPREINRVESLTSDQRSKFEVSKFHGSNDITKGKSRRSFENNITVASSMTMNPPQSSPLTNDGACLKDAPEEDFNSRSKSESSADQVLCNFKAAKAEQYSLKDIKGHLFNFCLDQAGSRFLQEQLALVSPGEVDTVHVELGAQTSTLMKDVFGNYIVQILLQNGSVIHRQKIAKQIKENTLELTLHVYGCRVVQKALEVLEYNEKCEMMRNLERHIARCVKDMNGNHVIQKAIREMKLEDIPYVLNSVQERGLSYAVHPYGCRVVQRILECECVAMEQLLKKESIMNKVVENVEELSQDLYGNYVVQHVLRFSGEAIRRRAVDALMTSPIDFACHKFASNVVETAVTFSNDEERKKIVNCIVYASDRGDRFDPLSLLTTNRFGNYVVQKLLDVVNGDAKQLLLSSITTRMKLLKRFKYGKHIVNRVEKMLAADQPSSSSEVEDECANWQ